jgi:hypothetical protein
MIAKLCVSVKGRGWRERRAARGGTRRDRKGTVFRRLRCVAGRLAILVVETDASDNTLDVHTEDVRLGFCAQKSTKKPSGRRKSSSYASSGAPRETVNRLNTV